MLNINLDEESEYYLLDILSAEKITSGELVKRLLRVQWLALQSSKTFLERRGESPQHLLKGPADLSDRGVRNQRIGDYLRHRHQAEQP